MCQLPCWWIMASGPESIAVGSVVVLRTLLMVVPWMAGEPIYALRVWAPQKYDSWG